MRVVSHTCSNTEIVCALGAADTLIGVDSDSDHPPEVVARLPKLGRDLQLDIDAVMALQPDLVLTSLTVPGHERIVEELQARGVRIWVSDPESLDQVFQEIREIGTLLERAPAAAELVQQMDAAMPAIERSHRPTIAVEWWPKPAIVAARRSWVRDLVWRAGGRLLGEDHELRSLSIEADQPPPAPVDAIAMSWCGVSVEKYRAEVVLRRPGWADQPAIRNRAVVPISEAFLGRPGPRLVEGYRALAQLMESLSD